MGKIRKVAGPSTGFLVRLLLFLPGLSDSQWTSPPFWCVLMLRLFVLSLFTDPRHATLS
jgi:hypothetical protein